MSTIIHLPSYFATREDQMVILIKRNITYFFNIPTHAHTVYTLKSTKIHIKIR